MNYFVFSSRQYIEAFNTAPSRLKDASSATKTATSIYAIAEQNNTIQSVSNLAALVGYILVGLLPVRILPGALQTEGKLSITSAQAVAQSIRREILAPVAHDLAALQAQAEQNYAQAQRETAAEQASSDVSTQQGPPLA